MRVIYLVKSYGENENFYKVGYTSNFWARLKNYITHNPSIKIIGTIEIYGKTKRQLESKVHKEIEKMGYKFVTRFGIKTEWFSVERNGEMDKALTENGLSVFENCKNRKFITWNA